MESKKVYVNDHGKGTLICDKCGKTRVMSHSDFKTVSKPLKVKCSCGYTFFMIMEVRRFYRRNTHLSGKYIKISNDVSHEPEKGAMTIADLSRTGLGFRTKARHNICVADMIQVRFTLDDVKHSEINKSAIVKQVTDNFVGAEFIDFDSFNEINCALGAYLMPR